VTNPVVVFASALLSSLPLLLIAVVGVVLSRSKLSHTHSKARRLATIGFSLLGLQALVGTTVRIYVTSLAVSSGDRLAATSALTAVGIVSYLLQAASLILLLCAVLADRGPRESSRGAI
jgi:hypothetical protein